MEEGKIAGTNIDNHFSKTSDPLIFKAKNGKNVIIEKTDIGKPRSVYETRTKLGKFLRKKNRYENGIDTNKRDKESKCYRVKKDEKANCLVTVDSELNNIIDKNFFYRKLTPLECERLQTLPDNYTCDLSARKKMRLLGNGWTVDVAVHIFSYIFLEKKKKEFREGI